MKKNRLLLNQEKFLSFSNYKKVINYSKESKNNYKLFLSANPPSSNLILNKKSFKNIIPNNNNNVPILINRNNSNKICTNSKSLKIFPLNQKIPKINISKIFDSNKDKKLNTQYFKYIIKKRKDENDQNNDNIARENNFNKKYTNKRFNNCYKNIFNKTNFRYSMNCSTREKIYDCENKNWEKNEEFIKILKSQNKCISSRKLNKECFGNGIYKIINERKGRKFKFKIIGTLKTEPSCN